MADDQELAKIANVLALLLIKDQSKGEAAMTLQACGFSNKQISGLTGSSEDSVRAMISSGKRKRADA